MTSSGIAVSPASTTTAPKGTARHVLTPITTASAGTSVPSHWIGRSMTPACRSSQLTTLYCELNIHFQAIALSARGTVQGRTRSTRTSPRPGKGRSSRKARATLSVILRAVATPPMSSVLRTARAKVGSCATSTKLRSPTNRPGRLTVVLVRL